MFTTIQKSSYAAVAFGAALLMCGSAQAQTVKPASLGDVGRVASASLEGADERDAANAGVLQTLAAIQSYQRQAGQVGQVLGRDLRVKRFAETEQANRDKVAGVLDAAASEADAPINRAGALPTNLSARLEQLYRTPATGFDSAFLASEILTDREALAAIARASQQDIDPAVREALEMTADALHAQQDRAEHLIATS